MIRLIASASVLSLLGACATTAELPPLDENAFIEAIAEVEEIALEPELATQPEMELPVSAPPQPGQIKTIRRVTRRVVSSNASPKQTIVQGATAARIEPSVDGYVNAIQVYPYTEGALYRVYASPGQISDIALQPGETLVSVSAGDTVRWVVGDTVSGSGPAARAHVLVKPISAGISTNLMIATDRRTYHIELESTEGGYMAALSWRYPQDELSKLQSRIGREYSRTERTVENSLSLADLNFDYVVEGDKPTWRPIRVFDDGRQVFIQMPDDLQSMDAPPLFILGARGHAELVNYRVRGTYYVVDHLFQAAELRLGTHPQTIVRVSKSKPRRGFAALFGN